MLLHQSYANALWLASATTRDTTPTFAYILTCSSCTKHYIGVCVSDTSVSNRWIEAFFVRWTLISSVHLFGKVLHQLFVTLLIVYVFACPNFYMLGLASKKKIKEQEYLSRLFFCLVMVLFYIFYQLSCFGFTCCQWESLFKPESNIKSKNDKAMTRPW